jgi:hypothetical protein
MAIVEDTITTLNNGIFQRIQRDEIGSISSRQYSVDEANRALQSAQAQLAYWQSLDAEAFKQQKIAEAQAEIAIWSSTLNN